jgi:hypothetical protein
MSENKAIDFPVWRTPEGEPVSCVEKIKVLNENLAELRELAQEALEDAVLRGSTRSPRAFRNSRRRSVRRSISVLCRSVSGIAKRTRPKKRRKAQPFWKSMKCGPAMIRRGGFSAVGCSHRAPPYRRSSIRSMTSICSIARPRAGRRAPLRAAPPERTRGRQGPRRASGDIARG